MAKLIAFVLIFLCFNCRADEVSKRKIAELVKQSKNAQPVGYMLTYVDDTDKSNTITQTEWFSKNAQFTEGGYIQDGQEIARVYITNSKYTATVIKEGSRDWILEDVAIAGTTQYRNMASENSVTQVPYGLGIISIEQLHEMSDYATWDANENTIKFAFPEKLPGEKKFPWISAEIVIADADDGSVPITIRDISSDGKTQFQNKKEFSGWRSLDGNAHVYSELTWENKNMRTGRKTLFSHNVLEDAVKDPAGEKRCWLTYYGLPEPNYGSSIGLYVMLATLAIASIVGLYFLQKRRRII